MARRLLALLLLLLLVAACAGGDGPPGDDGQPVSDRNPSTNASTVVVVPSVQVADGASEIVVTVTVRNAVGQALDGIDLTLEPATGAWSVTPELGVATTAADGTAAFTFTATAAGSHAVTVRAGSVALAPAAAFQFVAPLTLSGFGTSAPLVGEEFAFVAQVGGGLAPYAFERTGDPLPAGITFDAAAGELGGTPATTTPFGGTVTVRDASGQSASQAYRVEPVPPLPNAPVLQTKGQGDAGGQGTAASVPWPLRLADGDLVLVVVVSDRPANHRVPGFEVIVRTPAEAALQISAWYRIVSERPPGEIAVALGAEVVDYAVRSLRVTGQGATDPIGGTSTYFAMDSGDSIVRVPAITVGNRALLVGAVAYAGGGLEVVAPTGMALAWKTQVSMSTGGAFQEIETAGSTGDRVFRTSAPTGRRRSGILFEIRP